MFRPSLRFYEKLPGILTWTILIGPFVLSYAFPRAVAIFIMLYVMIWFFRGIKSSIFLIESYFTFKKFEKIKWDFLLQFFSPTPPNEDALSMYVMQRGKTIERELVLKVHKNVKSLKQKGLFVHWEAVHHVVLMATYKEEFDILDSSISALTKVDYPLEKIIFVLATEERDKERALKNTELLKKKYGTVFGRFISVMHPKNLPDEIPAKGANISYASAQVANQLIEEGIDLHTVLLTTLDADNRPHELYFKILTYHFLMEHDRVRVSFQPLAFFHNNIWEVPFTNRLVALANTFWYLSESAERERLFTASAYAVSMQNLVEVHFWSKTTIIEDLQQYWRTYFHFKGNYKLVPIFIPVFQDALENKSYFTSLVGQYKQLRRWAWAASVVGYIFVRMRELHNKKIPFPYFRTRLKAIELLYHQVMWATGPIILFLNQLIPSLINPEFSKSLFAYNIGQFLTVIFNIMLVGIFAYMFISLLSLPKPSGRFSRLRLWGTILSWVLLPIVTLFYGALPPLDAQTRLMFGKKLGFGVTEKVRKKA